MIGLAMIARVALLAQAASAPAQ
jgi:hypothetical protein